MDELLLKGLSKLGINSPPDALERYIDELLLWNPAYKLVAVEDRDELIIKHIFDSLAPLALLKQELERIALTSSQIKIADLGSGNGMPGLLLSLFLPEYAFSLVERSGRRVNFLRNAVAQCVAQNVEIIEDDLQQVKETFTVTLFRAFRPLSEILETVSALTEPGGVICAYKGRKVQIDEELKTIGDSRLTRWSVSVKPVSVPFLSAERNLLVLSDTIHLSEK